MIHILPSKLHCLKACISANQNNHSSAKVTIKSDCGACYRSIHTVNGTTGQIKDLNVLAMNSITMVEVNVGYLLWLTYCKNLIRHSESSVQVSQQRQLGQK